MKRISHVKVVTRTPAMAQSNYQVKLESITDIIDRLLLAQRQQPWKSTGPSGTVSDTTGGGTDAGAGGIPTQL